MTDEIEWWDYEDTTEMANALAGDIQFIIESAIEARGAAVIALSGGKTPIPVESVCDYPLIVPGRPNAVRLLLEEALKHAKKPAAFAMEFDNVATILDCSSAPDNRATIRTASR